MKISLVHTAPYPGKGSKAWLFIKYALTSAVPTPKSYRTLRTWECDEGFYREVLYEDPEVSLRSVFGGECFHLGGGS